MQLSYPINQPVANEGQRADNGAVDVLSMVHADIPQISTLTFGGTETDGSYTTSITLQSGETVDVTTERTGGTPATNTDLAAQHALDLEAALPGVFASVSPAAAVVTVEFADHGQVFPIATSAPAPGTLVAANTQDADSVDPLPIGKFVARLSGSDKTVKVLDGGDAVADIFGLIERPIGQLENTGDGGENVDLTDLTYPVPSMVPAGRKGRWMVKTEDDLASGATPFIRFTAGAGEVAGSLRSDADGGDALDASSIVTVLEGASAGGLVKIEVHIV